MGEFLVEYIVICSEIVHGDNSVHHHPKAILFGNLEIDNYINNY